MRAAPPEPDPDLDTIVESFASACRRGERPAIETWIERFPRFATDLRDLLPAVMALEKDGPTEAGPGARRVPAAPEIPERIGDYRLVREIGRGGMGVVFEAVEESLGRRVALKVLPALHLADDEDRSRFQREAAMASRLDHPGICAVHRAGVENGVAFLAMRFVEGGTLGAALRAARDAERPPRSREELGAVFRLVEGVARALQHAHEAGVVHRDIKPQNVMIEPRGHPVILDFGLARELGGDNTLTRTGFLCGTPAYLAPEALRLGKSVPAPGVDVYALGAVLFECLTLRRPFEAPTLDALYHAILHAGPPDVRRLNPALGRDAHAVVATALAKEPERRYASAGAFADDLRALAEGRPVPVRPPSPAGRIARWARREPAKALLAAALVVLVPALAAAGGFLAANLPQIRRGEAEASRDRLEEALERGFLVMGEGGGAAAVGAFDAALREDPACVEALAGLVLTHLYDSRFQAALATLDGRRDLEETCPQLGLLRDTALRGLKRFDEAARVASSVPPPASAVGWFVSGMRELDTFDRGNVDRFRRARDHLRRAAGLCAVARPYYLGALAYAASLAGDRALAEATAEALIGVWPDRAGSWSWRAWALHPVDAARAEESCRRALELDGGLLKAMDLLGTLLSRRGAHEEAVALHRRFVAASPRSAIAHVNLAATLRAAGGSPEEALGLNRRAAELEPGNAAVWSALGTACWGAGDVPAAAGHYRRAAELDPGIVGNWVLLGRACAELARHEEAAEAYGRAAAGDPASSDAHQGLARARIRLGEDDAAIEALNEAARLDPSRAAVFTNLAALHGRNGRDSEALAAAREAFRLDPRAGDAHANILTLLGPLGRLDEIVEVERRRAGALPEDAEAAAGYGVALLRIGRHVEAEEELRRAIGLDPDHAGARIRLAEALRHAGRFDEAVEAAREGRAAAERRPVSGLDAAALLEKEKAIARDAGLVRNLAGDELPPGDPERRAHLAWVALVAGEPAVARRLCRLLEAEAPEPFLDRRGAALGGFAATAAVALAAGSAESPESGKSGEAGGADRFALLLEAFEWFRAQLDADREPAGIAVPAAVRERWLRWLNDPRLASVRNPGRLAELSVVELRRWLILWQDARSFTGSR